MSVTEDHRPTNRVLDILEAISDSQEGLTLAQIARLLNAPPSSLHPFLRTLHKRGYVDCQQSSMLYTIGNKALRISAGFSQSDIYTLTRKEMQKVVDTCVEICQLGIRDGGNVFYIAKLESPEPLRIVSRVGLSLPASCTALGKALLCELSREEVESLYPDGLPALTDHSICDMDKLCYQLSNIRKGSFATESNESHMHLCCFALPIYFENHVDAAISVSLPDFRRTDDKILLIKDSLREAQKNIQRHLKDAGRGFSSTF